MEYIIESNALSKVYKNKKALDNVSIHVPKGSIYGLIGKNGAGKTTFLKIVSNLAAASSGEYKLFGKPSKEIKNDSLKIGTLIESPGILPKFTARQNMQVKCTAMGIKDKKVITDLLQLVGLGDVGKKKAGNFSLGMKQRLGMAMALIGSPELVILDEPINGLDPQGIIEVRNIISKLNKEKGITFIISSHILEELSKIATDYGIIDNGKLLEELDSKALFSKCGEKIELGTQDNEKACQTLKELGISDFSLDKNGYIYINEKSEKTAEINAQLVNSGIAVNHITSQNDSLEDYYISLIGGKAGNKNA